MKYFKANEDSGVTSSSQIAVVGDRLLTDMMLGNMMGSHGIWIKDGVKEYAAVGFVSSGYTESRFLLTPMLARKIRGKTRSFPHS
jgi:HAD superfamily phosphatase (TIGR01668 family)